MLVSWNWLKDYIAPQIAAAEVVDRLMMAGLNHESTTAAGDDLAIDLEVTSNRPDCLGHIGIAREAAVLLGIPLKVPDPQPKAGTAQVAELTSVELLCPDLCPRYTARVIRGIKVAASPAWLAKRLAAIGQPSINNVVDVTNYVLHECGQPLHAFDLARLRGRKIIVRTAKSGEKFLAINHETYELDASACVIADGERPVAIGGVMGGVDSEIGPGTSELFLESAEFAPLSIRNTARRLGLRSDSSYRFERGVDPAGVDWASRRACELILDMAGGELAAGVIDVGRQETERKPVVLRLSQLKRILGIDIPADVVRRIMTALGCEEQSHNAKEIAVIPPSWRRDLSREIDLVEEAARIHGYDKIPENVGVAMVASSRSDEDRVLDRLRRILNGAGCDEAMTPSAVDAELSAAFSPWTTAEPLAAAIPVLRKADRLRRSLVPSLLRARRDNEALANPWIELFEVARVYLPEGDGLPREEKIVALTSGRDFATIKGIVEAMLAAIHVTAPLSATATQQPLLDAARSAELKLNDETLGYLGELSDAGRAAFDLRGPATIVELRLDALSAAAKLVPRAAPLSNYPAIRRDLNVVFDEAVRWADVAAAVRTVATDKLESLDYVDTYRDDERLGKGKKSLLLNLSLRSLAGTLTRQEADDLTASIVTRLERDLGGKLRA